MDSSVTILGGYSFLFRSGACTSKDSQSYLNAPKFGLVDEEEFIGSGILPFVLKKGEKRIG